MEQKDKLKESTTRREKRVIFIIIVLFVISMGDLFATLLYHKLVKGMEMNQLANYLFDHAGDSFVVIYKLGLTALSLGMLYISRKYHVAERAAWFLFGTFVILTLYWLVFALVYAQIIPEGFF